MGTYEDVIGAVWGPLAKTVAEICVTVYCFGTCVAFLVVVGDQLDDSELCTQCGQARGSFLAGRRVELHRLCTTSVSPVVAESKGLWEVPAVCVHIALCMRMYVACMYVCKYVYAMRSGCKSCVCCMW